MRRKIEEKVVSMGKENWFSNLNVLKGRVMDPEVVGEVGMKELKEKAGLFTVDAFVSLCTSSSPQGGSL